jgi:hypothetical protein
MGLLVRGLVYIWQLLHCNPAFAWVPWVNESPRSLWQLLQSAVTVSAFGVWE